ncbi:MAG: FliA/WhiG family RNA polymerase sigma factor [Vicinamibacterales bacterium]
MRMTPSVADPDLTQRDALVMAHVELVRSVASRLSRRLPSHVEVSELVSVGILGLIDAATRYQPALGVPFDAFARRRVHGAMLDALRRLDHVPRSVRRQQRRLDECLTTLRHTLCREPLTAEIAAALGVDDEEYDRMLDELRWANLGVARTAGTGEDGADLLELAIDTDEGPYAKLERQQLRTQLAVVLGGLPERERQILALSYEQELTLAEIGLVLGVSESRVSQLRTQAVARLRSGLQDWLRSGRSN